MFGGKNWSEIPAVALGVNNQNLTNQQFDYYKPNIFATWLAVQVSYCLVMNNAFYATNTYTIVLLHFPHLLQRVWLKANSSPMTVYCHYMMYKDFYSSPSPEDLDISY